MSRHIPDDRLAAIHDEIRTLTRRAAQPVPAYGITSWGEQRHLIGVDLRDISCALDELKQRRHRDGKYGAKPIGPITKALMEMAPGDVIEVHPMTDGALTTCRKTARKHLNEPQAVWHSVTLENGMRRITRMPPGTPVHADYSNPAVYLLADMAVGDVLMLKTLQGKMHNQIKVKARRVMNDPAANWRCENLTSGNVRCRRVR